MKGATAVANGKGRAGRKDCGKVVLHQCDCVVPVFVGRCSAFVDLVPLLRHCARWWVCGLPAADVGEGRIHYDYCLCSRALLVRLAACMEGRWLLCCFRAALDARSPRADAVRSAQSYGSRSCVPGQRHAGVLRHTRHVRTAHVPWRDWPWACLRQSGRDPRSSQYLCNRPVLAAVLQRQVPTVKLRCKCVR